MTERDDIFGRLSRSDDTEREAAAALLRERRSGLSWTTGKGDSDRFESSATLAGSVVYRLDAAGVEAWVGEHFKGRSRVILARDPLLEQLGIESFMRIAQPELDIRTIPAPGDFNPLAFNEADVGVTVGIAGIADSGAVLAAVSRDENRSVSLLPDEHVVFLPTDRIVPSLHAAVPLLRKLIEIEHRSAVTLIGGPSKTADIEKVLVTGVHGPGILTIVLVDL